MSAYFGKLVLRVDDGWCVIEKAEHPGVGMFIPSGDNSAFWYCSSRIADADVEGSPGEMLALADAIIEGRSVEFRRCAVDARDEVALFWSPRNSQMRGAVDMIRARELAEHIKAMLQQSTKTKEGP